MKPIKANIVTFYELEPQWQAEAKRNLNEYAEENRFLEPNEDSNPEEHILWDLSEAMLYKGSHEGFKYNASLCISNNSAMLLNIDDNGEEAEYIIV